MEEYRISRLLKAVVGKEKSKEDRENISKRMKAVAKTDPRLQEGTQHMRAKEFTVRDPNGRIFHFVNLKHFVRTNRDLFKAEHLIPGNKGLCLAQKGLYALFGTSGRVPGSWYGWTAVSVTERAVGMGDLLGRDEALISKGNTPPSRS